MRAIGFVVLGLDTGDVALALVAVHGADVDAATKVDGLEGALRRVVAPLLDAAGAGSLAAVGYR